jgi:hypothetical protein
MLAPACSVLVSTLAVSVFCLGLASPAGGRGPTATKLAAKDPGALHGGNTIVASKRGAPVHGVPGRKNHMAALAAGATIHGGSGHDELGARAPRVTLRGRGGRDVIHGGRDGTLIGGPGADLLTATRSGATARAGPRDYVVLRGRGDRVVCRSGARGVVILRSPGTKVDPACRRGGARVRTDEVGSSRSPRARGAQQAVTGDGSIANPFRVPCDRGGVDCTVSAFPERTLSGSWTNEFVPAYQCPGGHPYLLNKTYSPPFTTWGWGVEIREDQSDFAIGVSITGQLLVDTPFPNDVFGGTLTGYPNSSATNWLWGGSHWYKVVLHCTSDPCRSTDLVGRPKGCRGNARRQLAERGRATS